MHRQIWQEDLFRNYFLSRSSNKQTNKREQRVAFLVKQTKHVNVQFMRNGYSFLADTVDHFQILLYFYL